MTGPDLLSDAPLNQLGSARQLATASNQGDGRLFGWRVPKKRNPTASITTEGMLEEMRIDLNRLVSLLQVNRLNRILGLVSGGQHLKS